MALAIALAVMVITLLSCGLLVWRHEWLPHPISTIAPAIDHQFAVSFIVCGILFVLAQLALAYMIWRYRARRKKMRVNPSRGSRTLEGVWTLAASVLFVGLGVTGYHTWARAHYTGAMPGALRIEVWAEQFQWYFHYPGPDGRLGPVHFNLMSDSTGNYLGLDPQLDPASRDDLVTPALGVPVNRPVQLILRSKDVIHSFFVPELRLKQDLVPGMEIPIYFTATHTGRYEIVCAQLCGLGHYKMRASLLVMTEPKFNAWLQKMAAEQ